MTFTDEDVPLMKLIFNPETHDMGMLVGGKRAEEIFGYICNFINRTQDFFIHRTSDFFYMILAYEKTANFFWDNNIIKTSLISKTDYVYLLINSPIAEKIWNSNNFPISTLSMTTIDYLIRSSPIAKKIWNSDKLDLSLLDDESFKYFKQKFNN